MEYEFKSQSLLNSTRHEPSSFAKLQQFSSVAERESYPSSLPYSDSDPEAATAADTEVTSTTIIILHSHCHQHSRLLCGVVLPWCVMAVVLRGAFVVFIASLAGLVLWCTPLPNLNFTIPSKFGNVALGTTISNIDRTWLVSLALEESRQLL
ncbi:hypothetical protein J6590_097588 [Homalodisca vitripennis]|nr:hypothetical protein J6590_097588 [Homalodisca vitripennis]